MAPASDAPQQQKTPRRRSKAPEMAQPLSPTSISKSSSIHAQESTPRSAYSSSEGVELQRLIHSSPLSDGRDPDDDDQHEIDGLLGYEKKSDGLSQKDKHAIALLIVLYLIQGVPVGLALGSMPFLLKSGLSYSQLAVFSLSSYPYSSKLLWSPIVDAKFVPKIGRRKSWIVPMQLVIGSTLFWISLHAEWIFENPETKVNQLTGIFGLLVFLSATQDIAVDGWALTLLSEPNLSYASTCQTIGLNTGFFASFTLFLAFSSPEFAAMLGLPVLTLRVYLRFWSIICLCVTIWLTFFKKEDPVASDDPDLDVAKVYKLMWKIIQLKHVWVLCCIHFIAKIGFVTNDAITSLKLVEKGLRKEHLSMIVTADFVVQLFGGYYAARWAIGDKPLRPWIYAFWGRLLGAISSMIVVYLFPTPPLSTTYLLLVAFNHIANQFASTVQFVGISAFHTRISDPLIGGTYMTLLNTVTNLGGTWPKYFVMKGVDVFSQATCHIKESTAEILVEASECISEHGKQACEELGGTCVTERDGYYFVSAACVAVGVLTLVGYIASTAKKLQALPVSRWRIGNI